MKKLLLLLLLIISATAAFASFSYQESSAGLQVNFVNEGDAIDQEEIFKVVAFPAESVDIAVSECEVSVYNEKGEFLRSENATRSGKVELVTSFVMREMYGHQVKLSVVEQDRTAGETKVLSRAKFTLVSTKDVAIPTTVSPAFTAAYATLADNYDESYLRYITDGEASMLVLVPAAQENIIEPFVNWKNARGIPTTVATFEEVGTTTQDIKAYIQTAYYSDNSPSYILLIGDVDDDLFAVPSYYITAEQDVTDHPYTLLEGDDFLPEMIIGRMCVDTIIQLQTIIAKVLFYEKSPYMGNTDWYKKALLVAGNYATSYPIPTTPVKVSKWLKEKLLNLEGYNEVDEVYYPGVYPGTTEIVNSINSGVGIVSYRGWGDANGWHFPEFKVTDMPGLNNGFQLPVVTSIVCNTGDFANTSVDPCFGEALLQQGNPATPQGCVTFMGPSDLHTSTKYNNAIFSGFYTGLYDENIHTFGDAVLRGKIELMNNFPLNMEIGGDVEFYFHVYNIIGDPTISMWTDIPEIISCTLPSEVNISTSHLELDLPGLDGAIVTAFKEGEYLNKAVVENGSALVYLNSESAGEIEITITKVNHHPFIQNIDVVAADVDVALSVTNIDDIIAGEEVTLSLTLDNYGSTEAATVTGTLSSDNVFVTIADGAVDFGTIAAGANSIQEIDVTIDGLCPDAEILQFNLDLGTLGMRKFEVVAAGLLVEVTEAEIAGDGYLAPGETTDITFEFTNMGSINLESLTVNAISLSDAVTISADPVSLGNISVDASGTATLSATADSDCYVGRNFTVEFTITDEDGLTGTAYRILTVGEVTTTSPTGHDNYGYYAYDSFDVDNSGDPFPETPTYSWYELNPEFGGDGEVVMVTDDQTESFQLPFDFQYYGNVYDSISVCSNGWASFQTTWYTDFTNWKVPNGLGAYAMISPFWDDLIGERYMDGTNEMFYDMKIITKYIEADDVFVIQWDDCWNNKDNVTVEKFQIVLYDPSVYATATGDGEIQFNYHTIGNVDVGAGNYATVGIESPSQQDGIDYSFADIYAPSASPLQNGLAIKFTTTSPDDLSSSEDPNVAPAALALAQNYPNPFNPVTNIKFNVPSSTPVILKVYNVKGELVKTLENSVLSQGSYTREWKGMDNQGSPVSSGIYFYKLSVDSKTLTKKCILLK